MSLLGMFFAGKTAPESSITQFIKRVQASGDKLCSKFWQKVNVFYTVVMGVFLFLVGAGDPLICLSIIVLVVAAIANHAEWRCSWRRWEVEMSSLVYGVGGVTILAVLLLDGLRREPEGSNLTLLTATSTIAKVVTTLADGSLDGSDSPELPMIDEGDIFAEFEGEDFGTFYAVDGFEDTEIELAELANHSVEPFDVATVGDLECEDAVGLDAATDVGDNFLESALGERWMVEAFIAIAGSLQVQDLLGSFDAKAREPPGLEPSAPESRAFASLFAETYKAKHSTLMDELHELLAMPRGEELPQAVSQAPSKAVVMMMSDLAKRNFGEFFSADTPGIAIWCMYLYTMQDVDIDRVMFFLDVPAFPEGKESPAERDEYYKPYRGSVKAFGPQGRRCPQMFQDANWGTRVSADTFHTDEPRTDALEAMERYIKWTACISCCRQKFDPPLVTSRGLCNVPDSILESLTSKKAGDLIFWAAMSSTTLDPTIAEHYANQQKPIEKNVLFVIHGVNEGLELRRISRYPKEQEFLLPACTVLRVREVALGPPAQLTVDFAGTLLDEAFQSTVREDVRRCQEELDKEQTQLMTSGGFQQRVLSSGCANVLRRASSKK